MKNKITTLFALTILASLSSIANAEYIIHMPTEVSNGGPLPNGTIGFVNGGSGGDNGSGTGGTDSGETGTQNPPVTEAPTVKTPLELCNDKAEAAKIIFASSYNDVFYVSHKIGESKNWFTGVTTEGCILTYSSPKNKATTCTGKTAYTDSISPKLLDGGLGIMKVEFQYYGTCS